MSYSLYSLVNTLDFIREPHPKFYTGDIQKTQLEILLQKAQILMNIVENFSPATYKRTESLRNQIDEAALKAKDIVDFALADQILMEPSDLDFFSPENIKANERFLFLFDLQHVIDQLSFLIEDEAIETMDQIPESPRDHVISLAPDVNSQDFVVGRDEDILQLRDRLTGNDCKGPVIPIVGMGGIGKTTLAQKLYCDSLIISHFDCVAWATISQEYDVKAILSSLIHCIPQDEKKTGSTSVLDPGLTLYQGLFGRRYLIILDDVWDTRVWDEIHMFFPNNNGGSRIILTTRELDVANYAKSQMSLNHQMNLLDDDESWCLLRTKMFGNGESIGGEFEKIGKRIATNCKGLPLAIHVISGLLSQSPRTEAFWMNVANGVSEAASSDERFVRILSLSYDHLPHHLKLCLLYLGFFREDRDIKVSKLMRLWAAEGLLKPAENKTPEEVAEEYLNCLEKRNLILIRKYKSDGKVKRYGVHDLLRDLFLKEASKVKFIDFNLDRPLFIPETYTEIERYKYEYISQHTRKPSSRVLQTWLYVDDMPKQILHAVNIRYLSIPGLVLTPVISRLWNLETIILHRRIGYIATPIVISELRKLRHFMVYYVRSDVWVTVDSVLEKLQTIGYIKPRRRGFFQKLPNLTRLRIRMNCMDVVDLSCLQKLETVNITYTGGPRGRRDITFPVHLKKLTLYECVIDQELMKIIGHLSKLKVLKIRKSSFTSQLNEGDELNPSLNFETLEDGFLSLQFLELGILNMQEMITDEAHFPSLRHLLIGRCHNLKEMPECIGDIPTLENIVTGKRKYTEYLHAYPMSFLASLIRIEKAQRYQGNEHLQFHVVQDVRNWRPPKGNAIA